MHCLEVADDEDVELVEGLLVGGNPLEIDVGHVRAFEEHVRRVCTSE